MTCQRINPHGYLVIIHCNTCAEGVLITQQYPEELLKVLNKNLRPMKTRPDQARLSGLLQPLPVIEGTLPLAPTSRATPSVDIFLHRCRYQSIVGKPCMFLVNRPSSRPSTAHDNFLFLLITVKLNQIKKM
uniref:Uncharacterized protein n=1 Tax=Glossina pallidipes TaxID=7398 RepID=A0A1B0A009_GLOPL